MRKVVGRRTDLAMRLRPPAVCGSVFRGRRPGPVTLETTRFVIEIGSELLGAPIEGPQSCDEVVEGVEIGAEGGHVAASWSWSVAASSPAR